MFSLTGIRFWKKTLKIKIKGDKPLNALVLRYRNKLEKDRCEYAFAIQNKGQMAWRADLVLSDIDLKVIYWDLYAQTDDGEEPVAVGSLKNLIRFPLYDGKYRNKETGMFMHPYITPEKNIAFQYREYTPQDTLGFRIREGFVLLLYFILSPFIKRKNIVLVYEKFCQMAEDNGFYFFKYCMDNELEKKRSCHIYYIIDKASKDKEMLIPYEKNVIPFMSLKHKLYMLGAKQLVSTDTRKHLYAWRMRMSLISHMVRKIPLIFLQHGVLGLKRVEHIYGKGQVGECNLFIVSSDYEKEIVRENFGYRDDEIAVTGLARWDVLSDKSDTIIPGSIDYNMLLLMPTWRNWLEEVDDETFVNSEYFKRYSELLGSKELMVLLEKRNLQLCFYIHPKFRNYIKDFDVDNRRIRIVQFGEEPLNQLIMRCKMLITDYSSVSWDVFYQHKPVTFYQFDLDRYTESQGSYMDMKTELFGDRVTDIHKLIRIVDGYANTNFKLKAEYDNMYNRYFKYVDDDNSARIAGYLQINT